jgi:hypothetical protein
MATVNIKQLFEEVKPALIRQRKGLSYGAALSAFNGAYDELMEDFENDPVTIEIEGGPGASNSSGLLGGRGNLYGFLGFEDGREPIEQIRELLDKIALSSDCSVSIESDYDVLYQYDVKTPTEDDLIDATKMDWESGNSWAEGIEEGVSGLSNYIYWKGHGRSTAGFQGPTPFTPAEMETKEYVLTFFRRFLNRIEGE